MSEAPTGIIVTDARPIPRDGRCPVCQAPESARVTVAPFGRPPSRVCGQCGHECPEDR